MLLQLVMISLMSIIEGRTLTPGYRELGSPSSYVFKHWYDPAADSGGNNYATDNVEKQDINNHILSSVLHIFNIDIRNAGLQQDDLLSSIYEDILDPVIKETVERKKQSNTDVKNVTRTQTIKEKEFLTQENTIFSNMLTPETQKKVNQGISILMSSIPNYQVLLGYVVYIIGGTIVMSLPALG